MPLNLAKPGATTVDDTGAEEIYDATSKDNDVKRFATLGLCVPMKPREDGSNIVKPHIIFSASRFKTQDDWDQDETQHYHPGVKVSFHKNAWTDWLGHKYFLDECLKPIRRST